MDVHRLTPQGDQLLVRVVDGQFIVPSASCRLRENPANESKASAAPCEEPGCDVHSDFVGQRQG